MMDDDELLRPYELHKYIPAGCLRLSNLDELDQDDRSFLALSSSSPEPDSLKGSHPIWTVLLHDTELTRAKRRPLDGYPNNQRLRDELLKISSLKQYADLFNKHWIRFQSTFDGGDSSLAIIRTYVLPDDVERTTVQRHDVALRKDLRKLLSALDYSSETWRGNFMADIVSNPSPSEAILESSSSGDDDASLLHMFNTIPAPNPQPSAVIYDLLREAMERILTSSISGLKTPLYAYQTRSAALMLQREAQPGRILDPRLMHLSDQHGKTWYYDDHTGTVFLEPRYYDAPSGGILAEEMGTGKTLICLSLILATKEFPADIPELYKDTSPPVRHRVASLVDMAAQVVVRESVPWRLFFSHSPTDVFEDKRAAAIRRQQEERGFYLKHHIQDTRRQQRSVTREIPPVKIHLSNCSLIIVPNNLIKQWQAEIAKHTEGLQVLNWPKAEAPTPSVKMIIESDIVLISQSSFEQLDDRRTLSERGWTLDSPLAEVQFKRVIVDEGHKLGNSRVSKKSNTLLVLETLNISSRWIVTATPSTGLIGVDNPAPPPSTSAQATPLNEVDGNKVPSTKQGGEKLAQSSWLQEKKDLEHIGAMASLYLKVRPWANTAQESGDTPADWQVYVMQKKHSPRSRGRKDCLRATLNSLIIRHPRSEVGVLLPEVDEKVVFLDGCYQDQLCLNLFSMMIIFNAVQSQRTDRDYFFHPTQRSALLLLVSNIQQSTFFGGSFYSPEDLGKAVETATKFIEDQKFEISKEDEALLQSALAFGLIAVQNRIKSLAEMCHEVPLYVENFPGGEEMGKSWSLDERGDGPICTNAPMVHALQTIVAPHVDDPYYLECRFNDGYFTRSGLNELAKIKKQVVDNSTSTKPGQGKEGSEKAALAGNTKLGTDKPQITHRSGALGTPARMNHIPAQDDVPEKKVAEPLSRARIVSTASAKLSYLIDSIVKHQHDEQIIVFFENENVAFYLAEHLEILNIHHLIYAKGITAARRAQYVDTFNNNPKFRVFLMDLSQGAFGIDLRSASRVYFISPVLNPQVEAQAIGRVRRISQKRHVSVETLVLRGSLEEVIMQRRQRMTQAEHRRCKTILDDRAIYDWILNRSISDMPVGIDGAELADMEQMAPLATPQLIFGRGFGQVEHPDEDLAPTSPDRPKKVNGEGMTEASASTNGLKRTVEQGNSSVATADAPKPKKVKMSVRFAD